MAYRVIGSDGLERELGALADWVAAIRSGAVDDAGLFWNAPEGRWARVASLEIYGRAKAMARSGAGTEPEAAPPCAMDRVADPQPTGPSGDAAAPERVPRRRRGMALALGALALLILAAWWAGGAQSAAGTVLARLPWQAWLGAAVLIGLIVAEEFHWIALGVLGFRRSTFRTRFAVQAFSASLTALALYAVSRNPDYFGRWYVWANQRYGVRAEPDFFEKFVAALANGDAKSALVFAFVQHAVLLGGLHACAVLATSAVLLRIDLVRNLFASLLVAAMVFGTLYMALAPASSAPPRRGTDRPAEIRSASAPPAPRHGAVRGDCTGFGRPHRPGFFSVVAAGLRG